MHFGGNLSIFRVYLFAIFVEKYRLFTKIKRVLFREISVFHMSIFLAKL